MLCSVLALLAALNILTFVDVATKSLCRCIFGGPDKFLDAWMATKTIGSAKRFWFPIGRPSIGDSNATFTCVVLRASV